MRKKISVIICLTIFVLLLGVGVVKAYTVYYDPFEIAYRLIVRGTATFKNVVNVMGATFNGKVLKFASGTSTKMIDLNRGSSKIYDDGDLKIATDNRLFLNAPTYVKVKNDLYTGGDIYVFSKKVNDVWRGQIFVTGPAVGDEYPFLMIGQWDEDAIGLLGIGATDVASVIALMDSGSGGLKATLASGTPVAGFGNIGLMLGSPSKEEFPARAGDSLLIFGDTNGNPAFMIDSANHYDVTIGDPDLVTQPDLKVYGDLTVEGTATFTGAINSWQFGSSSAMEGDTVADTLLSMNTTGWSVKDDGDNDYDHSLVLSTSNVRIEYTLEKADGTYIHDEVSLGNPVTITFPHYQAFTLTLARHGYIANLRCNENDGAIACLWQKSHK